MFVRYLLATSLCLAITEVTQAMNPDADADSAPGFRIVFFTPSDVEPPDGVSLRLRESVEYAQQFYGKWMKHWGYASDSPLPVELDAHGAPKVLFVKGRFDEASGRYTKLGFEPEVVEAACEKYDIDPKGQVWWIFTYRGPERRGFRGGGNAKRGGISTAIYDPEAEGRLVVDVELASDDAPKNSKASIHELGHALGLPHLGPLQNDKLGNSLMGPVVKAYRSRFPQEQRVYLTKASAAMIWKHPLFSGSTKDRELTPKLEIADLDVAYDNADERMVVTGKVVSDHTAHSVVIANQSDATRSDYWRKCFVDRVKEDGSFEVVMDELDQSDGQLRIVACFNNGAVVGRDGLGLSSGFTKQYYFRDETYQIEEGWALPKQRQRRRRRSELGGN